MAGFRSSLAWSQALLFVVSASACGLRSDPFAPDYVLNEGGDDESNDSDEGDPFRPGTCNDPLALPFSRTIVRGELSGPSFSEGWCGSDGGPEDIYTLVVDYDVDVILTLDAGATEFTPTLRVIESGCTVGTGFTKICTRSFAEEPFHFLAQAGQVYSVIIDSRQGGEGRYEFTLDFGQPPLELCGVHPELIEQLPGSSFLWNNDFSQGQGRVDGYCGGPGRENMFAIDAGYPGNVFVAVEGSAGFAPVVSLRTECGAISELACDSAPAGGVVELGYFIAQPGRYYLVVDQAEIGSGGYSLRVDFD